MFRTHWWSDSILGFRWAPPTIAMISHAVVCMLCSLTESNAQLYASTGHSACQPKTFSCSVSQTPVFSFWSTCLVMCCLPLLLLLLLRIPSPHAHDTRERGKVTCVFVDLMHALSKLCPLSSTVLGSAVRSEKEDWSSSNFNAQIARLLDLKSHPQRFSPPRILVFTTSICLPHPQTFMARTRQVESSSQVHPDQCRSFRPVFRPKWLQCVRVAGFPLTSADHALCDESVPTFLYVLVLRGISKCGCQSELVRICSASLLPTGGIRGASRPATVSCPVPPISLTV